MRESFLKKKPIESPKESTKNPKKSAQRIRLIKSKPERIPPPQRMSKECQEESRLCRINQDGERWRIPERRGRCRRSSGMIIRSSGIHLHLATDSAAARPSWPSGQYLAAPVHPERRLGNPLKSPEERKEMPIYPTGYSPPIPSHIPSLSPSLR